MKEIDRIYIAQYYEKLGLKEISKSFYVTKDKIQKEVEAMKKNGTYVIYRDMSEGEWELLEQRTDRYIKEKYYKLAREKIINELFKEFEVNMHETIMAFPKYEYKKEDFDRNYMQEEDYQNEEWKQIGDLNYEISNYGRIKNTQTKKLKQLKFNKYGMQVLLWKNSKSYTVTISRLVAEMFIRHVEKNEKVFHINNNIRDNYYKNLYIRQV